MSESSIKRWVDDGSIAAERTAGGHRRIPVAAALRFIRDQRAQLAKPELLPLEAAPQLGRIDSDAVEALATALEKDQPLQARSIIAGRFVAGASVAAIGDDLLRPVMERLGELWLHGPQGVLLEHRAVDTCVHALAEIGAWLPAAAASAPSAVTAGGPGDPYLLPPMLAALVLRESGIAVHNLGPCSPIETVAIAIERYGARLCSVSLSAALPARAEAGWAELDRVASAMGATVVVGGRSAGTLPAKVRQRVRSCATMTELGTFATGWLQGVARSATQ